jgi:hypothetical protein
MLCKYHLPRRWSAVRQNDAIDFLKIQPKECTYICTCIKHMYMHRTKPVHGHFILHTSKSVKLWLTAHNFFVLDKFSCVETHIVIATTYNYTVHMYIMYLWPKTVAEIRTRHRLFWRRTRWPLCRSAAPGPDKICVCITFIVGTYV